MTLGNSDAGILSAGAVMSLSVAAIFWRLRRSVASRQGADGSTRSTRLGNRIALFCTLQALYLAIAALAGPGVFGRTGYLYARLSVIVVGAVTFWLVIGRAGTMNPASNQDSQERPPLNGGRTQPTRRLTFKYQLACAIALLASAAVVAPVWLLSARGFASFAGVDFDQPTRGQPGAALFDFLFFLSIPVMAVSLVWLAVVLLGWVAHKTGALTRDEARVLVIRGEAPDRWRRQTPAA